MSAGQAFPGVMGAMSPIPNNPKRYGADKNLAPKTSVAQLTNAAVMPGLSSLGGGGIPSTFKLNSPAIKMKYGFFEARNRPQGPIQARGPGIMGYISPSPAGPYALVHAPNDLLPKTPGPLRTGAGFTTDAGGNQPQ